jgi:hypothetical protein
MNRPTPQRTLGLLAAGSAVMFTLAWILAPATQRGYQQLRDDLSALETVTATRPWIIGLHIPRLRAAQSNLDHASLVGAKLGDATLAAATLRKADLTRADLRTANLTGADLDGPVLRGADLSHAQLADACLTGAIADQGEHPEWRHRRLTKVR